MKLMDKIYDKHFQLPGCKDISFNDGTFTVTNGGCNCTIKSFDNINQSRDEKPFPKIWSMYNQKSQVSNEEEMSEVKNLK